MSPLIVRTTQSPRGFRGLTPPARQKKRQSILYWRRSIIDPDRPFTWLEPKIRFFWTRAFLVFSAGCIALAILILWTGRQQVATSFAHVLRWETLFLAWLVMFAVGMLHESAHGLTCKHYGGEVHEIGFLLMYFMPCFYCNVSDAWLFREKSKRLWVTFAGRVFRAVPLGVGGLRLAADRCPTRLSNYLAFVLLSPSPASTRFFNFNPLIKLDGYYLLSDWLEIPNLRKRSFDYTMGRLRWLLWGAARPHAQPRGRFLLGFGLTSWVYSLTFLLLMLVALRHWLSDSLGLLGLPVICVLGFVSFRGLLGGLFKEEFLTMLWRRHLRTAVWGTSLAGLVGVSLLVPWTDRAAGEFEVRARTHVELRAPVAGFLRSVQFEEGQNVSQGCEIARLGIPDLVSRITRKEAELREAEAELRLLQAGPRAEEIAQQQRRVDAARAWRDVAERNLQRQQDVLEQEMIRFDRLLEEYSAESNHAQQLLDRYDDLRRAAAISENQYADALKTHQVACARRGQTEAERRSRAALGTSMAESELAEREKELTVEEATLALLQAGTRSEEIEAAQATVERLREQVSSLNDVSDRLLIQSTTAGVITTCRLREKIGNYFEEGELICVVEDARQLEIVIALDEDQAARVQPGQRVRLKARSLAFEVFEVEVERIAPRAATGEVQSNVNVYCRLNDPGGVLRSGMTGHARIDCGRASIATVVSTKCLRFIRTEFWW